MSWRAALRMRLGHLDLDVDLEGDGRPVALIGPNGSGKTTLLRTVAGAYRPDAGLIRIGERILFDGERGVDLPPEERRVGYVPQGYGLFPHLRVVDNVAFGSGPGSPGGASRKARRAAAVQLLGRLSCAHLADRWPTSLSGGEQQRVALARSLAIDPQILLLDEPLSALDASARRSLRSYLATHVSVTGAPTIVVTQDPRDVRALGAAVFVLEKGKIVQHGEPADLSARPATEFVAEFFGSDFPASGDAPSSEMS